MNQKKFLPVFLALAILFVVLFLLCNITSIFDVFQVILSALLPVIVGLCIAFVLNLLLRPLEHLWNRIFRMKFRRARRPICLILTLLIVFLCIYALLVAIIPQLVRTVMELIKEIPSYVTTIQGWYASLSENMAQKGVSLPALEVDTAQVTAFVAQFLEQNGGDILNLTISLAGSLFSFVFDTVLAVVLAIYILAQKRSLGARVKKLMHAIFSDRHADQITRLAYTSERIFAKFISGQLTEALIIGSLCFLGMLIFRMPYPLLISVLVGVTALIPIFGAFIGTGIGAFLILLKDPMQAVWFVIFILILQQIEGNLIYPKVVGKSVGLPGVWVLIAVTVGSSFGIVGMLISVPVCSLVYSLLREFVNRRHEE
ncbi:MAG: AI-2E family transporter [Clostridia bacterium]|nr:AI-2E family transporter [Clostridia bacterium]